jgi:hypothetical protein
MKKSTLLFLILTLTFVFGTNLSCKKKKKDTIGKVYVKDETGNTVNYCQVILKGVSTTGKSSNIADTAFTNSNGEAIFNLNDMYQLGQAGVAVLDIFASKDGMTGTGIIQINQETSSEATVVIQ